MKRVFIALALAPLRLRAAGAASRAARAEPARRRHPRLHPGCGAGDRAHLHHRSERAGPGLGGDRAAACPAPNISSCSCRRCAPTACRGAVAGGALRIQPVAGALRRRAGRAPRSSPSSFVTEILRVRNIDAAAAVETLRPLVSRDGSLTASRSSIVVSDFADNVARVRQVLARIDVDSGVTRIVGLDNAGAREIAAALGELAPDGVSVVPVDSSNALAFRGDARGGSQLIGIAQELDRRAAQRQRDPGRLPRACRCRAIAAGASAGARADADPADPAPALARPPPHSATAEPVERRCRPADDRRNRSPAPPAALRRRRDRSQPRSARATPSSPASRAPMRSSSRPARTSSARWAS